VWSSCASQGEEFLRTLLPAQSLIAQELEAFANRPPIQRGANASALTYDVEMRAG
jgi:hypothetical protein